VDLWIDTETFSPIALRNGTARYATQADVMITTWAIDDGASQVWDVTSGRSMPDELYEGVMLCDRILAHNAYFDRTLLEHTDWWPKKYAPLEKWRCVMAQLLSHGLPGGLDLACKIFQIDAASSKIDGKAFINLFCKPQGKKKTRATRLTHPKEWAGFLEYARLDIDAMRAVSKKCPKWNSTPFERDLWHLDQRINSRGFAVDVELAHAAIFMTTKTKHELAEITEDLTNGAVKSTTQRDKLLQYLLAECNVSLPDLKAATIEARLEDPELPDVVKELLRIRLQASKSSTTKYKRVAETEVGGRLYGTLQFAGANRTQRWAGRIFQPQNLQRLDTELVQKHFGLPSLKDVKKKHIQQYLDDGIAALKRHDADLLFDNVMGLAANAVRGVIVAAKNKKLVISDLSNIEGRKLAWLADEDWKLDAFRAFDAGIGSDLYRIAYARAFGIRPEDVTDDQRQIGKVMELALGYQGGVGAFVSMVATYGIDLDELARKAWGTIPSTILREAEAAWARAVSKRSTLGLKREVWVVCTALTWLWRNAHPNTVALWSLCETAARNAIMNPNTEFPVNGGKLVFDRKGNWLRIRLPSGRYLSYPDPKIDGHSIHYAAVNVYTKSWQRVYTYGGKIVENIDQASSRDVMAYAMMRAEHKAYSTVLTVHDELVTEVPDDPSWSEKGLSALLATNAPWNRGLPLAAKGFETYRYRKD
jgi:DNA polymerase